MEGVGGGVGGGWGWVPPTGGTPPRHRFPPSDGGGSHRAEGGVRGKLPLWSFSLYEHPKKGPKIILRGVAVGAGVRCVVVLGRGVWWRVGVCVGVWWGAECGGCGGGGGSGVGCV